MSEYTAVVLAALIGAVLGSVGAVLTGHLLTGRLEKRHKRETLAQRYLFQLQDAVEALWYRLHNLRYEGGEHVMTPLYRQLSTLYALGRVLAAERILVLEGVYPQIQAAYPELGETLKKHRVERKLQNVGFYQYDRLALAEALIEREGDRLRTSTYLEFRKRYEAEASPEQEWLRPAEEAIERLSEPQLDALLDTLHEIAKHTAKETGVLNSSKERSNRKPPDTPDTF